MRAMTKSAVRLAREALAVGERALPRYSARTSRHDYTQAQLFALLVLKQFFRTDYRGVVTLVAEWSDLRRALGLAKVPHYSTLCYAERRLVKGGPSPSSRLLASAGRVTPASSRSRRSSPSTRRGSSGTTSVPTSSTDAARSSAAGAATGPSSRPSPTRRRT